MSVICIIIILTKLQFSLAIGHAVGTPINSLVCLTESEQRAGSCSSTLRFFIIQNIGDIEKH